MEMYGNVLKKITLFITPGFGILHVLRRIVIKLAELPNKILNRRKNDDIKLMK